MSENSVYNSTGVFKCSNNGQLFYSNGSLVISNQTFCSFTATWNGQEDLQCWTAPKPTLIGLTGISGTNLTISCEYEDVIPVGTGSIIFYGNRTIRMLMGQTFNLFVQSEDDSKEIFCQAVTPYTKLFNQSGISEMKVLRVLFQSYQNNSTTCKWQVDEEGSCDVEFYANPLPQFVDLTKDGSAIKNDIVNNLWIEANYAVLYRFQRKAVSQADSGVYTLILWSPHFPNNHSIKFTINAFKKPLEQKFAALIVVCSLLGVAWMAVIIPYAFEKIRQTKGNTYEEVKFTPKKRKQKVEWTNCGS